MPTTTIATEVSQETATWLELEARARGLDAAKVVASILENAAESASPRIKDASHLTPEERLRRFHEFTNKLEARPPGPPVDCSRESIYED